MVPAVLKLYFIGTALTVLAVIYGIVDSFGGLMFPQDHHHHHDYITELETRDSKARSPCRPGRASPLTKHMGS